MTDTPYPTDTKPEAAQWLRACPTCGLRLPPQVNECPQDGTRLPLGFENDATFRHKYEFIETIGVGGMGVIYKARQLAMNKLVAVKMLHAEMPSDGALRRFQLEGKTGSLLKHKYIIQIYDLGLTESGRPFMIMDYLQGRTLAQELSANGTLAEERFVRLFLQVTEGLSHAHGKGVLHRDLKPSNLMLVKDNGVEEVRIMDFGIAKLLDGTEYGAQQLTKTGEALGSPLYMSPEQCRSGKIDHRADLYSLGCVMYEALTGAPPFIGSTSLETIMMHVEQQPLRMSKASLGREIDPGLEDIVMRLLQKDPADRYQSADELESDLLKFQDAAYGGKRVRFVYQEPQQGTSTADLKKANRSQSARQKAIAAVGIVAAGATLGTGIYFFCWHQPPVEHPEPTKLSETIMSQVWQDQKVENYLAEPDVKEWVASKAETQQREIELDHGFGEMTSATNKDLEPLRKAANAEKIVFPKSSKVDDEALQYIKNLKLKILDISETGVQKLASLKKMDSLRTIDASKTPLDTDGMRVLAGLHNLENLFISRTAIQDSDLALLKDMHKLKSLWITDCSHITEAGVQHLQSDLPNLKIVYNGEISPGEVSEAAAREADRLLGEKKYALAETKYARILAHLNEQGIPNNKAIAVFLKRRADCCFLMNQFTRADQYYAQAQGLIDKTQAPRFYALLISKQASCAEALFNSTHDRKQLLRAIQLREKANAIYDEFHYYTMDEVDQYRLLGCDYGGAGEPTKAVKTLEKAVALFKEIKLSDCAPAGWAMNSLAENYLKLGRLADAERAFKATAANYRISRKSLEQVVFQRLDTSIAYCEFAQKHYAEAEHLLQKLLPQKCSDERLRLNQVDVMRGTLYAQKKVEQAQAYDKQSADLSAKLKKSR